MALRGVAMAPTEFSRGLGAPRLPGPMLPLGPFAFFFPRALAIGAPTKPHGGEWEKGSQAIGRRGTVKGRVDFSSPPFVTPLFWALSATLVTPHDPE